MPKHFAKIGICLTLLFTAGCAAQIHAPKQTDGNPITIDYYCDTSITQEVSAENAVQIKEVSDFMERHFDGYATKSGYQVDILTDKSAYVPQQGHFLLVVKVKKYNPGSKTLRIVVGFGAGAASMDTHYELYAGSNTPILSKDDGVGSSNPNWIVIPAKLNEKMLVEVTKAIKDRT